MTKEWESIQKKGSVAGDAPFEGENDDEKPGRQGIGNVGDDEETNLHPSDLAKARAEIVTKKIRN